MVKAAARPTDRSIDRSFIGVRGRLESAINRNDGHSSSCAQQRSPRAAPISNSASQRDSMPNRALKGLLTSRVACEKYLIDVLEGTTPHSEVFSAF
jgi:hypothetical protein